MPRRKVQWIGLGTAVARATSRVGIRPCASCLKRKALFNAWAPRAIPTVTREKPASSSGEPNLWRRRRGR